MSLNLPLTLSHSSSAPRFSHFDSNYFQSTKSSKLISPIAHSNSSANIRRSTAAPSPAKISRPEFSPSPLPADECFPDEFDVSASLSLVFDRLTENFSQTFARSPHASFVAREFSRISLCAARNLGSIKIFQRKFADAERSRDEAKFGEKELREKFDSIRLFEWSDKEKLKKSISEIDAEIKKFSRIVEIRDEKMSNDDESEIGSGVGSNSEVESLIAEKFLKLENLIFLMKKKFASLQKYPYQEEIEEKFGSIEGLLARVDQLNKENERLKRRETRFAHAPLLKRRILSNCEPAFLYLLVTALQNELAQAKESAKLMKSMNFLTSLSQSNSINRPGHSRKASSESVEFSHSAAEFAEALDGLNIETIFLDANPGSESTARLGDKNPLLSVEDENFHLKTRIALSEAKISSLNNEIQKLKNREKEKLNHGTEVKEIKKSVQIDENSVVATGPTVRINGKSKVSFSAQAQSQALSEANSTIERLKYRIHENEENLKLANERIDHLENQTQQANELISDSTKNSLKAQKQRDQFMGVIGRIFEQFPEVYSKFSVAVPQSTQLDIPNFHRIPSVKRAGSIRNSARN